MRPNSICEKMLSDYIFSASFEAKEFGKGFGKGFGVLKMVPTRCQRFCLVTDLDDIQVWIDDRPMVNTSIKGRHLSLRSGEIDRCVPLGFAYWRTTG